MGSGEEWSVRDGKARGVVGLNRHMSDLTRMGVWLSVVRLVRWPGRATWDNLRLPNLTNQTDLST